MAKPLISGELKEKLDEAMAKTIAWAKSLNPNLDMANLSKTNQWRVLHVAMTDPDCHADNSVSMGKLMDQVYAIGNDGHLTTYLKGYFSAKKKV